MLKFLAALSLIVLAGPAFAVPQGQPSPAAAQMAPLITTPSAQPSSLGAWSSPSTQDSGVATGRRHHHTITGAATLGEPTTGWSLIPEMSGDIFSLTNYSGWNNSLSGNGGRTGVAAQYLRIDQYGQGDLGGYVCSGVVASQLAGATNYLAEPAIECVSGGLYGGAAGEMIEFYGDNDIVDNGNDIAAVMNSDVHKRSVAMEGLGVNWIDRIVQSIGGAPLDALDRLSGSFVAGIDMTNATMGFYRLASVTVNSGGSGYAVGDLLTVSGGTSVTSTVFKVATLGTSNSIATVSVVNTGIYTTPPVSSYTTLTTTGGTGSGANLAGQYTANSVLVLPAAGGCIRPGASTGSPVAEMTGVYSSLCIDQGGLTFGGLNNSRPSSLNSNNVIFGDQNNLLGTGNFVAGQYVYDEAQKNAFYWSSGSFAGYNNGRSQISIRIFRQSGTGSLRLTVDANAAGAQNTYLAPASSAHNIGWRCNAIDTTNVANTATWSTWRGGALTRGSSGSAAYAGAGSSAVTPDQSSGTGSTATVTLAADTTWNGVNVTFAPPAGGDAWRAQCRLDIDQLLSN